MVDILTCYVQLKLISKAECPFLIYRLFVKIKNLPLLSTINLASMEFIHILKVFYQLPISLVLFTNSIIDPDECAQLGLNCTLK